MAVERQFICDKSRFRKVLPPEPYSVEQYGQFLFETHRITEKNREELRDRGVYFEDYVDYARRRTTHEIDHNIRSGGEAVFVKGKRLGIAGVWDRFLELALHKPAEFHDIGIVTQEIREAVINKETVRAVVIGIKAIKPEYRAGRHGLHIGTKLAEMVILKYHPKYVIGKTRNTGVPPTYFNTGLVSEIRPLQRPLTQSDQQVMSTMLEPEELSNSNFKTDLTTGIIENAYPRTDKDIRPKKEKYEWIFTRYEEMGILPAITGKGMRYVGEINGKAVDSRIDEEGQVKVGQAELLEVRPLSNIVGQVLNRVAFLYSQR